MVKKMAYKIINEWWSESGKSHELTIYKYNLSHDEVIRYHYDLGDKYVTFAWQMFGVPKMGEGIYEVIKYKMLANKEEIALVHLGEGE